uniref:glutathione transferase n=1 Tax=Anopheles farauti TaxID=69004 RepID=A0A182QGA1_9DIPT
MDYYYNFVSPPSQCPLLVARKLGIELNLKNTNIYDPAEREALSKLNAHYTLPMLIDNGNFIFESYAIVLYLVETHAKDETLYPKDPKVRTVVNQRLFFDIGTLFKQVYENIHMVLMKLKPSEKQELKLAQATALLEHFLTVRPYVAADYLTVADICLFVSVNALRLWLRYDMGPYPHVRAWFEKVTAAIPDGVEFRNQTEQATMAYVASRKLF